MKQTFNLPDNASALYFVCPLALTLANSDFDKLNDHDSEDDYQDVSSMSYRHEGYDDKMANVVVVKSRYLLPQCEQIYSDDADELAALEAMSEVPELVEDVSAATLYLADNKPTVAERFEHDLAPFKQDVDIIVKPFGDITVAADQWAGQWLSFQLEVDGVLWLSRVTTDLTQSVVEWTDKKDDSINRAPTESLNAGHLQLDSYNRLYQGNHGSHYLVNHNGGVLTGSEQVLLKRYFTNGSNTHLSTYRFALPTQQIDARYYYYCGRGRDQFSHWCFETFDMVIDTIEIFPDEGYLTICRRGHWFDGELSADQYRELKLHLPHSQEVN